MKSFLKESFEDTLGLHVLPSLCIGCGACVVVCPFECLDYVNEKPVLVTECKSCGICAQVCPRYKVSLPLLERIVFGKEREKKEYFGIFRSMVIAKATDKEILRRCQDGGVVTAILSCCLEDGEIEGAVLSGVSDLQPLKAIPKLALSRKDIISCAGTRYTYSPSMFALKEGIIKKKRNLGFVGTPDQILAFRRIQAFPLNKYVKAVAFTIGLFCTECFSYEGLIDELILGRLGINPVEVRKMNIKGRLIVSRESGQLTTVPLKELNRFVRDCYSNCPDFSAELADISVGGIGLNGWTLAIVRNEKGESLIQKAEAKGAIQTRPVTDEPKVLKLLVKMSKWKKHKDSDLT